MYDHLVIAVDGSDEARRAARHGIRFARAFDAAVTVLSVVERAAVRLVETAATEKRLRERSATALADVERIAAELGHPVTTATLDGNPAVRIGDYAAERNADAIVVGRRGATGLGTRLLGGVTERIVRRSDVPVFVVPDETPDGGDDPDYERVLVTTDGSERAEAAIPHGTVIARRFGSDLHVLNVVDLQAAGGVFNAGGLERELLERLDARGRDAVDRAASGVRESAPELTVRTAVERTTSFGGAAAGVREYVGTADIDLVVMSSHGRSNLRRQLLGSVASTVLRSVDVPVLVVPRSE